MPGSAPDRLANVTGALLLGGASTRLGRDKAGIELGGITAAGRLSRLLASLFEEVLLVGGTPPSDAVGRPVNDPEGPRCALRGLVGALAAARAERVLVLATDLPLATPDLLLALVAWPAADAVVPRTAHGPQPLCALYRREPALAGARTHLAAGRLALHTLLESLETVYLEPRDLAALDPDGSALLNVNTLEDLAQARARLEAGTG